VAIVFVKQGRAIQTALKTVATLIALEMMANAMRNAPHTAVDGLLSATTRLKASSFAQMQRIMSPVATY
jgi:hypothetical protein